MIPMTPAHESSTTCSCPNPEGQPCHRPNAGNRGHRAGTGKHKHLERLRGTACDRECSEREGTLMARSTRSADTGEPRLTCQRWGGYDEGTAALCAVDLTTVSRCQRVAPRRAQSHHQQVVQDVDVPGVPWDAAHATRRPTQGAWGQTA